MLCCFSVMSDSLRPHGLQPARLLSPWGFSRQEYWSGLPCPPPGDLPNPGIEPRSPPFQVDFLLSEPPDTRVDPRSNMAGVLIRKEKTLWVINTEGKWPYEDGGRH